MLAPHSNFAPSCGQCDASGINITGWLPEIICGCVIEAGMIPHVHDVSFRVTAVWGGGCVMALGKSPHVPAKLWGQARTSSSRPLHSCASSSSHEPLCSTSCLILWLSLLAGQQRSCGLWAPETGADREESSDVESAGQIPGAGVKRYSPIFGKVI